MMPWQIASLISIIMAVTMSLVQRRYSQRSSVPTTFPPAASYVLGVLPVGLFAGFFLLPHSINWTWEIAVLIVISGCGMTFAKWTEFIAAKRLPVTKFQTIHRSYTIFVIALGWVLLDEKLNKYQLIGATLLFIAMLLAIRAPVKNENNEHKSIEIKSVLIALGSAAAFAIGLVSEKAVLNNADIGASLIFVWSAQTLGMVLLAMKDINKETIKKFNAYEIKWSAAMGASLGIAGIFYVIAVVEANNISLVIAAMSVSLPLLVFAAHVILKERDNTKLLWASVAIAFIGLLIGSIS